VLPTPVFDGALPTDGSAKAVRSATSANKEVRARLEMNILNLLNAFKIKVPLLGGWLSLSAKIKYIITTLKL
jgi:hypothetical protein